MPSKYIVGGGLSGLIAAYYNPEYTVLAPEYGGFVDSKFGQAFVVLHEDEAMLELFRDLDLDAFVKELKIAYYDDNGAGLMRSASDNFGRAYVEEKLPPEFQPGKDLELSAPGDEWRALFVDESIVSALMGEVRNKKTAFVKEISPDTLKIDPAVGREQRVEWDELVVTTPAPMTKRLFENTPDWTLDHHPTTYVEITDIPLRYRSRAWNLLYTIDDEVPFHRVVRNMLSSNYFAECLGAHEDDEGRIHGFEDFEVVDWMVNGTGVIDDEDLEAPYDNVSFLGRYAEWQHDVLINDVIERCKTGP